MKASSANWISHAAGGAVGGGVFLLLQVVMASGFVPALVGAGVGYAGAYLLAAPRKSSARDVQLASAGITVDELASVAREGRERVELVRALAKGAKDPEAAAAIGAIADAIARIYQNYAEDPKDLRTSGRFRTVHLEAGINIVRRYVELEERRLASAEARATMDRAIALLRKIREAFEVHLGKLQEDNLLDLDSEIAVLEQSLKMEGLSQP